MDGCATRHAAKTKSLLTTALTAAAGAASIAGGLADASIQKHSEEGAPGVTESEATSSDQLKAARRAEKLAQRAIPLLTGVLVLNARQGDLQRQVTGRLEDARGRAKRIIGR